MYFGSSESLHVPAQYITFDSHVYHQKSLFTLLVLIFGSFLLYYCLIIIIITLLKKYKKHASLYRYPKKCIKGRFMCNWVKGFRRSKLNLNSTTFQQSLIFSSNSFSVSQNTSLNCTWACLESFYEELYNYILFV